MPIQVKYMDDGIGVEIIASEVVTGKDIINANTLINSHENFLKQRYKLINRTLITDYRVSTDEIHIIAEQEIAAAKVNPDVIIALISITDHQIGMTRVYQAYISESGLKTKIFRDRDSAVAWIEEQLNQAKDSS